MRVGERGRLGTLEEVLTETGLHAAREILKDFRRGQAALITYEVRVNRRLKRAAGRCLPWRGLIELHPDVVARPEWFRETLLHEAAHAVIPEDGHGPLWRTLARRLGSSGNVYADYQLSTRRLKVVGRCERCGEEVKRYQRLKANRTYRHKDCGGLILRATEEK